jgi:hypothetical protein
MIGGPGIALPYPANPYPVPLPPGLSSAAWSNQVYMTPGETFNLPPGKWGIVTPAGTYIQFLDPVSTTWQPLTTTIAYHEVVSDGQNFRVANLSGIPQPTLTIGGTNTGYTQGNASVTAGTGGSTWRVLVDGKMGTPVIGTDKNGVTGGTNWVLPPTVWIQAPPAGGIQATALATVSGGAVNAITVQASGAGYASAPGVVLIPNPNDPNIGTITIPSITIPLAAAAGTITAMIMVLPGDHVASAPTMTVAGTNTAVATATSTLVAADGTSATVWIQALGGIS